METEINQPLKKHVVVDADDHSRITLLSKKLTSTTRKPHPRNVVVRMALDLLEKKVG